MYINWTMDIHRNPNPSSKTSFAFCQGIQCFKPLTLGHKPLTLTPIYRSHIHLCLTHSHNTFFSIVFFQLYKHKPSIIFLSLLHNMSSSSVNWLVHYNAQIIKTDKGNTFQCPNPMLFQTKQDLTLEVLKRKIHQRLGLQPLDQVCNISFWHQQVVGAKCSSLQ